MTKDKTPHLKDTKDKTPHLKETKETKDKETKGKSKLVGRVKKVIKKSRRKLGEEKFEKELQRTIEFLAQLQIKLDNSHDGREGNGTPGKVEKNSVKRAGRKIENKTSRGAAKKAKPSKKSVKKAAGNGAGRKGRGAAPQIKDPTSAAETVMTLQAETPSMEQ